MGARDELFPNENLLRRIAPAEFAGPWSIMTGLESTAAFSERALAIGLDSGFSKKMTDKDPDTYGKLAFVCSCRRASGDDAPLFNAVKDLTGEKVPAKEVMVLRRLWFEPIRGRSSHWYKLLLAHSGCPRPCLVCWQGASPGQGLAFNEKDASFPVS